MSYTLVNERVRVDGNWEMVCFTYDMSQQEKVTETGILSGNNGSPTHIPDHPGSFLEEFKLTVFPQTVTKITFSIFCGDTEKSPPPARKYSREVSVKIICQLRLFVFCCQPKLPTTQDSLCFRFG